MRHFYLILSLFVSLFSRQGALAFGSLGDVFAGGVITASIDSPVSGQVVQGAVVIRGSTAVDLFLSYQIDYASTADPAQSWFLIQQSGIPVQDDILAVWDTNKIIDGEYNLRLTIIKTDGSRSEVPVVGLNVENSTGININAPTPTGKYVTLNPGTGTTTPFPQGAQASAIKLLSSTPTPLPANPVEITAPQVMSTFGIGAAFSIGLLVLLGVYVGLRAFLNGRK